MASYPYRGSERDARYDRFSELRLEVSIRKAYGSRAANRQVSGVALAKKHHANPLQHELAQSATPRARGTPPPPRPPPPPPPPPPPGGPGPPAAARPHPPRVGPARHEQPWFSSHRWPWISPGSARVRRGGTAPNGPGRPRASR